MKPNSSIKNERGAAVLLLVIGVAFMVVTFLGSASAYFGSLYSEIARLQNNLIAHHAVQSVAVMALEGRRAYLHRNRNDEDGQCPEGYFLRADHHLCWTFGKWGRCVPFSTGDGYNQENGTARRWICFNPQNDNESRMELIVQVEERPLPFPDNLLDRFYTAKNDFSRGLDVIAEKLQNVAYAQAERGHLPVLTSQPQMGFNTVINCAENIVNRKKIYCKRCPGNGEKNLDFCFRFRMCLRPQGCGSADNSYEWVYQRIGFISR